MQKSSRLGTPLPPPQLLLNFVLRRSSKMSLVLGLVKRLLVLLIGLYYAVVFCFGKILLDTIRLGPRKVFSCKKRNKPPDCLEDPSLGTHGYVHLENIRIHYVSSGSEDKPLMLLVHGFPEFWYSWRHQLREFKDIYRVVAVDLRGYNETDKPSGVSNYFLSKMIEDLKQLITALGYNNCILVGHDWGGALGWNFIETYPDFVTHLIILNCPNMRIFENYLQTSLTQFKMSWYVFFFQIPWLPELAFWLRDYAALDYLFLSREIGVTSGKMSEDDVEAYKYSLSRSGFTGPFNFYRALLSLKSLTHPMSEEGVKRQKDITVPTLIIWGDKDGALERVLAEKSRDVCKGKVILQYIEGASHWVQMDRPDLVNECIRKFLTE